MSDAASDLKERMLRKPFGTFPFYYETESIQLKVPARTKNLITLPVANPELGKGY